MKLGTGCIIYKLPHTPTPPPPPPQKKKKTKIKKSLIFSG